MSSYNDNKLDEMYSNRIKGRQKFNTSDVKIPVKPEKKSSISQRKKIKEVDSRKGEIFVNSMLQRMKEDKYI